MRREGFADYRIVFGDGLLGHQFLQMGAKERQTFFRG
jgi:hypothetical protein